MAKLRISEGQMDIMRRLVLKPESAYRLQCSMRQMESLQRQNMIMMVPAPGNMAFPRNAEWRLTSAGKAFMKGNQNG